MYAVTKLAGEELCKAYAQRYPNLNYTILRYFNTFGPFQMAQFVIPRFIRNALNGDDLVINGDGKQERSYCYSEDTAYATVEALINQNANNEVINLGNSDSLISINDLAKVIIKSCGQESKVTIRNERDFSNTDRVKEREIYNRYCDTSKAENILGFKPKISLLDGIKKVIETGIIQPKWATSDLDYTIDDWL